MDPHSKIIGYIVRAIILLLGLFILAQGIAFTILANLGSDAITSPALIAHLYLGKKNSGLNYECCTIGNMLICIHTALVILQIIILRSKYHPIQLLQLLMAIILGQMLDICMSYTSLLPIPNYSFRIVYTLLGCFIGAFGIFTYIKADLIPLSAEGLCLAITRTYKLRFSRVKIALDCTMITIAVLASVVIFGRIIGVREGSLICAVSTGYIMGLLLRSCSIWDNLFSTLGIQTESEKNGEKLE